MSTPAQFFSQLASSLRHRDAPLFVLMLAAVAAGVWLRLQQLDYPPSLGLDEGEFLNNARRLLEGKADRNDHPPLGKLLMALAMFVREPNVEAARTAQMVSGVLLVPIVYLLGTRSFQDHRVGIVAAGLVALDGPFVAYSRVALLDGFLFSFVALAVLLATYRHPLGWVLAGLAAGLAGSVKLSGFLITLVVAVAVFQGARSWRRTLGWGLVSAVACIAAYWAVGTVTGYLIDDPEPMTYALRDTRADLERHLGATTRHHAMASRWYTWFLPNRVITFDLIADAAGTVRMRSMVGNPLLWWSVLLAVVLAFGRALLSLSKIAAERFGAAARVELDGQAGEPDGRAAGRGGCTGETAWGMSRLASLPLRSHGLMALAWLVPILPWMISSRDSYLYHYIPSHLFGLIALAGWLAQVHTRRRRLALTLLGVVLTVSAFYAPVWCALPLSFSEVDLRMFLWR